MAYTREKRVEIAKLNGITLRYDSKQLVFEDASCTFYQKGFYFLTGVSGAGKSSLLKLLYRGIKPNRGEVSVFGESIQEIPNYKIPAIRQRMGLVFHDCHLLDHLTALENTILPLVVNNKTTPSTQSHAKELLDWVGLSHLIHNFPNTLSDGQRQRLALARAVITRPLLLLADEPTGNVDDGAAYKLMTLLETLNKNGTTIVMATHNKSLVRSYGYPEFHIRNKNIHLVNEDLQEAQHG